MLVEPPAALHVVPASSGWLNLVERWFGQLAYKAIRRGVFRSVDELKVAIDGFLKAWNKNPKLFVWMATVAPITAKGPRCRDP